MAKKKYNTFIDSLLNNKEAFFNYLKFLEEIALSVYEWKNLPETVSARMIEMNLCERGSILFFKDDVLGFLVLPYVDRSPRNLEDEPIVRRAFSPNQNGYSNDLDDTNSVIIYNNYMRHNTLSMIDYYARQLWEMDRIVLINAIAQKTPTLVTGTPEQRLSLVNLYKEWSGNSPVIFGDEHLDMKNLTVLKTDAPFIADKILDVKNQILNDAYTFLGIVNPDQKKERMITSEVSSINAPALLAAESRLKTRKQACEKINRMFGLNIDVDYTSEIKKARGEDINE